MSTYNKSITLVMNTWSSMVSSFWPSGWPNSLAWIIAKCSKHLRFSSVISLPAISKQSFFRLPRQISKGGHHLASPHFLQRRVDFKSCQLGYWLVHPSQLFDDGEQILPPQSVSPLQYSWRRHLIINRFFIFTCQLIKRFYRLYPALYRFK